MAKLRSLVQAQRPDGRRTEKYLWGPSWRDMKQDTPAGSNFIEPVKALRVRELPVGNWLYEMKFDGYRALAFKAGKEIRLLSRNRTLFNDNYPILIDALKSLKAKNFILDGEIAALDQTGKSSWVCGLTVHMRLPDQGLIWEDIKWKFPL
jgi:ATP-dependent DNA ligase